jgi:hypothetical protein
MILNPKTPSPENIFRAIQYGFYTLYNTLSYEATNIKITPKYSSIFNHSFYYFDYLRVWNSPLLFKLKHFWEYHLKSKWNIPRIDYQDKIVR